MADILGAIGDFAEPIGGALDFLAPQAQPAGGDFSIGSLLKSVAGGAKDVIGQGPGAILGAGKEALDFANDLSPRDRLLFGGLAAAGAGMMARQAHMAWKQSLQPDMLKAAPAGQDALVRLGDPDRYMPSPLGYAAHRARPGSTMRQADMMGAVDYDGVIAALRRWDPSDAAAETAAKPLFERYAMRVGSAEFAQVDWARFDYAVQAGIFSGPSNTRIRKLWTTLTSNPQSLTAEEAEELFGVVSAVSEATQAAGDDFTVGIVGRIERIEMTDNGPVLYTKHPIGWTHGTATAPMVREDRLRQLNYRQMVPRGKQMLKRLYMLGYEDWNRAPDVARRLPADLEIGPEWYPRARADVAKAFDLPNEDSDALERAVAAVSFLSEAEDWSTNITKAKGVMRGAAVQEGVNDADFQAWIRSNKDAPYLGKRAAQHQKTFNALHKQFTSTGFKVSQRDLGVVLRLLGHEESVAQIFAGTLRRKQRNFYLNIYHPELDAPVTIDRHAFDAFLGMDTGINDRPIDLPIGDGDQVYDVVADAYRDLAGELSEELGRHVPPHELQAVVWETWRILKKDAGRNGWGRNDPFMLPEADGSTNAVFEALNGRDISSSPGSLAGRQSLMMPTGILKVDTDGLASAALPDGTVAHIAEISDDVSAQLRHLFPAILGRDGVPRWFPLRANPVRSISQVRSSLATDIGARGEAYLNTQLDSFGPHPVLDGTDTVTVELDIDQPLPKMKGLKVVDMGRVEVDEPEYLLDRLRPEDIDPKQFMDPERSPLRTHAWAAISSELGEEQILRQGIEGYNSRQRQQALRAELLRRGYHPIDMEGIYEGGSESSFLIFGLSPAEALELGERFGQDSVITNHGFLYNRKLTNLEPFGLDLDDQYTKDQFARVSRMYGKGDVSAAFGEADIETTPWPSAARLKDGSQWDQEMINEAVRQPGETQMIDPRYLHATQPRIVRTHAQRYMDNPDSAPATPEASNQRVYVYERADGRRDLLTGHHRALRALLRGEPLQAVVIKEARRQAAPTLRYNIPDDADFRSKLVVGGQEVTWALDDFGGGERYDPSSLGRTTRIRRKVAVKLGPKSQVGIVEAAEELEAKGGRNASIYSRRPSIRYNQYGVDVGENWHRVTEHLYDDGIQTYALRTTDPYITAPNAGFVFTKSVDGLPKEAPKIQTSETFDDVVAKLQGVEVTRRGEKVILRPIEEGEVSAAIEAKARLEQFGGTFELHAEGEKFTFPTEPKFTRRQAVVLRNGKLLPPPRRDSPLPDWERDFGFEFDPGYRVGNTVERLDTKVIAALRQITETFYGQYEGAFRRWRLPRVTVSPGYRKQYAQLEWRPGGLIVLSKEWWGDMDQFMRVLWEDRETGWLARGADVSPESILAHEYGHVLHGALVANEGWVKSPKFDKELRKLVRSQGEGSWKTAAERQISTTAGVDISELVAESFSEFYTGKPSRLSRTVVDFVNERLQDSLKARKAIGL